jgi:hypothetical protein
MDSNHRLECAHNKPCIQSMPISSPYYIKNKEYEGL